MSKLNIFFTIFILVALVVFGAWLYFDNINAHNNQPMVQTDQPNTNANREILSFDFEKLSPVVKGVITQENHMVTLWVPQNTDLTQLVPTIKVSDGAFVKPASDAPQNFNNIVVYKVTASDGRHQDYTVKVVTIQKPVRAITSFTIAGQVGNTIINQDDHTIALAMPFGTNLVNLMPAIGLIVGASIDPMSTWPEDFTKPVKYTVTTADNAHQTYTVNVSIAPEIPSPVPALTQ